MTRLIDLVLTCVFFSLSSVLLNSVPVLFINRHDGDIRNHNLPAFHSERLEEGPVLQLFQIQRGSRGHSGKEDHVQVDVTREQFSATCKLLHFYF